MNKKWTLTFLIAVILVFSMSVQVMAEEEEDGGEEGGSIEIIDAITIAILSIAIVITFTVTIKRKDLFKYLLGFIAFFFAFLFQALEEATENIFFCVFMAISVLIASSIFCTAVFIDYYTQVRNQKKINIKNLLKNK